MDSGALGVSANSFRIWYGSEERKKKKDGAWEEEVEN
jgi:hypothetical protein